MQEKSLIPQERNPYQIMDRMDDSLIEAELENRIVTTWVYSFTGSDGKFQSGLSKVGVDACCTEMAKTGHIIREGEIRFQIDPTDSEYVLFQGMAERYVVNNDGTEVKMEIVNGTKRQWTMMKSKGKIINDPFWYEKGAMKAIRNARARMIPEEIRTKIITLAKQKGRVKDVNSSQKPLKPPQSKKLDESIPEAGEKKKVLWKDRIDSFVTSMQGYEEKLGLDVYVKILEKNEVDPDQIKNMTEGKGMILYNDLENAYKELQEIEES